MSRSYDVDYTTQYLLERHEQVLEQVSRQGERWESVPESRVLAIQDRYADELATSPTSEPEKALRLWRLLCLEEGVDIVGGWTGSGTFETYEAEEERKRRFFKRNADILSQRLPEFAAYLKRFGKPSGWSTTDWETLLRGLRVVDFPTVVHFLFYGLGKPKDFVSTMARTQYGWLTSYFDNGVPPPYLVARVYPCVNVDTSMHLVYKLMRANSDRLEDIVIGIQPSAVAPLLLTYFFADYLGTGGTDVKPFSGYYVFSGCAEYLWESIEEVPQQLRTEIIRFMFNERFTELHREAFRHERGITSYNHELVQELPSWNYRQPTDKEERGFRQWLEEKTNRDYWNGHKRSRIYEFEDDDYEQRSAKRQKQADETKRPPYSHPVYSDDEALHISEHGGAVWDVRLLNNTCICSLRITDIDDAHYEALIQHPTFCQQLRLFHAGSTSSGKGSTIKANTLIHFVQQCPNLLDLKFESHCLADRTVVDTVLLTCPNIKFLGITGNDRTKGSLNPRDFQLLDREENWGRWLDLVELFLLDQDTHPMEALERIVAKRPRLAVTTGDTSVDDSAGDSIASQMIAAFRSGSRKNRLLGDDAPMKLSEYTAGWDAAARCSDIIIDSLPLPSLFEDRYTPID